MCCQLANGYMSPCPGVSLGQDGDGSCDTRPMYAEMKTHRQLTRALTDLAKQLSVDLSSRLSYFALETQCEVPTSYIKTYRMASAEHSVFAETQQFFIKQR